MIGAEIKILFSSLSLKTKISLLFFLVAIVLIAVTYSFNSRFDNAVQSGSAPYLDWKEVKHCSAGSRLGDKGAIYGEESSNGIKFNVRTPENYDATIAHPLLMVFAPAKANRSKTEVLTELTFPATQAGFVVAYADHPPLSATTSLELAEIPRMISKKWCIDEGRIFYSGHSDGGSVAMALGFMSDDNAIPAAIVSSAAGLNFRELYEHVCPSPLSVMVIHSANDRLFPGFGVESSGWWAACNDCDPIPEKRADGCISYPNCAQNVRTLYCEGQQPHSQWVSVLNINIIEFLAVIKKR
jgi:polyhydroxybutyrate depolymerase